MIYVEFGFYRSRGFGSVMSQFWPLAIDRPTRPYNTASTAVQPVMTAPDSFDLQLKVA
jgi:hypothetical protein